MRCEDAESGLPCGVVLLPINAAAGLVLLGLDHVLLAARDLAVLERVRLGALDHGLLALEARRLLGVELAGLQALLDALLLVHVALRVGLGARRVVGERERARGGEQGERDQIAFHGPRVSVWLRNGRCRSRCHQRGAPRAVDRLRGLPLTRRSAP
jgi:hypothetical protein